MRTARINRSKNGDLRVWNIINPPRDPETYPANDVEHAIRLIDAMADSQLLVREIGPNVFGLEVYRDGEWEDWESEDGDSVNEYRRDRERRRLETISAASDFMSTTTENGGDRPLQQPDGRPERTATVKKIGWWEVRTWDSGAGCWRNAGESMTKEWIDAFVQRGKREGFAVQVWWVVAVERTEKVKRLEDGSPIVGVSDECPPRASEIEKP